MTNSAKKIIFDACLSVLRTPKRKSKISSEVVACRHCGRARITLRKEAEGYTCLHCYLENKKLKQRGNLV